MASAQGFKSLSQSNVSSPATHQASSTPRAPQQLRTPSNRKTIYDRNLNRTRTAELSRASFAYLFSEMVSYAQKRVTGIQDLERRCGPQLSVPCCEDRFFLSSIFHPDSTSKATPSVSASYLSSFTVNPRVPPFALTASFLCSSSSTGLFGGTSLGVQRTPSSIPLP